jgi:hypothetical protein
MRSTARTTAAVLLLAALASGQDAATAPNDETETIRTESFAVDLPADWRELTALEARELGDTLPYELRTAGRSEIRVFGAIDTWLREGFDGLAFVAVSRSGEIAADEEALTELRSRIEEWRGHDGRRREVVSAQTTTVGPDAHPACAILTRTLSTDGSKIADASEIYAPSGGRLLILGSWSWETRGTHVSPESPPVWARSIRFARRPSGPDRRGNQILFALGLGVVLALFLLSLRKRRVDGAPAGTGPRNG